MTILYSDRLEDAEKMIGRRRDRTLAMAKRRGVNLSAEKAEEAARKSLELLRKEMGGEFRWLVPDTAEEAAEMQRC